MDYQNNFDSFINQNQAENSKDELSKNKAFNNKLEPIENLISQNTQEFLKNNNFKSNLSNDGSSRVTNCPFPHIGNTIKNDFNSNNNHKIRSRLMNNINKECLSQKNIDSAIANNTYYSSTLENSRNNNNICQILSTENFENSFKYQTFHKNTYRNGEFSEKAFKNRRRLFIRTNMEYTKSNFHITSSSNSTKPTRELTDFNSKNQTSSKNLSHLYFGDTLMLRTKSNFNYSNINTITRNNLESTQNNINNVFNNNDSTFNKDNKLLSNLNSNIKIFNNKDLALKTFFSKKENIFDKYMYFMESNLNLKKDKKGFRSKKHHKDKNIENQLEAYNTTGKLKKFEKKFKNQVSKEKDDDSTLAEILFINKV